MNQETAILIAGLLLKYGPELARRVADIFAKKDITLTDWEAVFKLAEKPFESYVPNPPNKG